MFKKYIILLVSEILLLFIFMNINIKVNSINYNPTFQQGQNLSSLTTETNVVDENKTIVTIESVDLDLFKVNEVDVSITANPNISSFQFGLKYKSNAIRIIEVVVNPSLKGEFTADLRNLNSMIISYSQNSNITENIKLFTIKVQVVNVNNYGDISSISLSDTYSNAFFTQDQDGPKPLDFEVIQGMLQIGLSGDANLDGVVNLTDAILVKMYSEGKINYESKICKLLDVNSDSVVNNVDVEMIQSYMAGLIDSFDLRVKKVTFVYENYQLDYYVKNGWSLENIPKPPIKTGFQAYWDVTDFSSISSDLIVHPIYSQKIDVVIIEGENSVYEGGTTKLVATVLPAGASQEVIWSSLTETVATVSQDGTVTALKEGNAYIVATSKLNPNVNTIFTVYVAIKPILPDYPDLGGYEIKIMAAEHALYEHDPFSDLYTDINKEAKQQAWLAVEESFNTNLNVVPYPSEAAWGSPRIAWLNHNASLNQAKTDIFVSTTNWLMELAVGGSALDVSSYYRKYGKNQMYPTQKFASTYRGGLYSLPTTNVGNTFVDKGLFYNFSLIESLGLESPAKMFNENRWTYSDFKQYVLDASSLLNDGQSVLSGQPGYYYIGMVNSGGIKLADTLTLTMNFDNQNAIDSVNLLRDLYVTTGWGTVGWDTSVTSFNEGNSIFQPGEYWYLNSPGRWPKDLWDPSGNSKYGYVPFPYPDDKTSDDARTVYSGGTCYMQAAGRVYPTGVTAEDVYWAFTEMMIKTDEILNQDPTYSEALVVQKVSDKLADPQSVTALLSFSRNKIIYDPIYGMHSPTYIGAPLKNVVVGGNDYDQEIQTIIGYYYNKLLELYS